MQNIIDTLISKIKLGFKFIVALVVIWIFLQVFAKFRFIVEPGEVAFVKTFWQIADTTYTPWFYLKRPLIDSVVFFNIQTQKAQTNVSAASKDLQTVNAEIAVNYAIDQSQVKQIFSTIWQSDIVDDRIVNPSVQEGVKAVTAKYTAEELVTKRALISTEITNDLKEKMDKYGVIVIDVNIINFAFSAWFEQAIENKVRAEQEALSEKNTLEKVKYQAQQTIETERAKAEAIRIQAEAITSKGGAEYVKLKWIEKRDGQLPKTQFGQAGNFIVDLQQQTQ